MMDTFASRKDQRAAWAFSSVGVLVFVFFSFFLTFFLSHVAVCERSCMLTGIVSSGNHDAQWIHASATGGNNTIRKVSLVPETNHKRVINLHDSKTENHNYSPFLSFR